MSVKSYSFTVQAPVQSAAPAWFAGSGGGSTGLPYLTWVPLAAGQLRTDLQPWQRGRTIKDEVPPGPYQGNQSPDDIIQAGNGAAVDQARLEMMLVANGGHSGYQGNEGYRLVLNTAIPYYQRMTEPTPYADLNWHIDADATANPEGNQYWARNQRLSPGNGIAASNGRVWNSPTAGTTFDIRYYPACAGDGSVSDPASNRSRQQWTPWNITSLNDINDRPRTMHTAHTPWYVNGRIWFPLQNSVDVGTGFSLNVVLSFNADTVRAGTMPRQFVPGRDVWDYWRSVPELSTTGNLFGASALDSYTGRVWYHAGGTSRFYGVRTTPGVEGTYAPAYSDPNAANNCFLLAASAVCPVPGRRLWVVLATGANSNNSLRVFNLESIEASGATTGNCQVIANIPTLANKSWNFNHNDAADLKKSWGMVWYEPDKSFLLYNCDDMNNGTAITGNLRRIKMPLNPDGTYKSNATAAEWICDEIVIAGPVPTYVTSLGTASVSGGSFTRFNIFNNMGNGESMLVQQGNYDTPCYVCRLPNQTLQGV
jgi:hypothetical protein